MNRCPNGHFTSATDYCDVCGAPVSAGSADAEAPGSTPAVSPDAAPDGAPDATATTEPCPSCGAPHTPDALFCESCGYDFTTGAMPRPLTPPEVAAPGAAPTDAAPAVPPPTADEIAPTGVPAWVAEVWVDPDWYAEAQSPDALPAAGPPRTVVLTGRSALVGRPSASRNIHPDVDCGDDTGVSRRHAQLTTDGTRFWVEDLESANGTFVGPASGPLPKQPVPVGAKTPLDADDRLYVGAWTRLVIRPATPEDQAAESA